MLTYLEEFGESLLMMLAEMCPYLLLGFFFAGLLRAFVPKSVYKKHLSPRTMGSVVKAAALGIPLPLCSCGVIPTSVELRRSGASHGACASFLIATPQTGVDSIAATYSMMGLPFAIIRPVSALFTSLFGGWLVNRYAKEDEEKSALASQQDEHSHCDCHDQDCGCSCGHDDCDEEHEGFLHRFVHSMRYAFVDMLQDVGKWLIIGLLIAALITVAVPNEWLATLHDYKLLNMLIVLCIAIPMYVCATGSIPIAVSLMAKGLTPGAALVLLMAGPAVNSASMLVIGNVFGKRTLKLYLLSIVIGAIAFGLCIDYLLPADWFTVSGVLCDSCHGGHSISIAEWVFIGVFMLLLANAFIRQALHSHHIKHNHKPTTDNMEENKPAAKIYEISGMSCNHCKMSVEKAIGSVAGVESVNVDLPGGKAYVRGEHKVAEVIAAVKEAGFGIVESRESRVESRESHAASV